VTAAIADDRGHRRSLAARVAIVLIRGYQYAFSWTKPRCRFWPTCSQYTLIAVREHGAWRGIALGARRLARCHPWNPGGYDPVPEANVCSHAGAGANRREG
jgi:hypothetical protein